MATYVENPGGAVVEVTDDRAEELLAQDGFAEAEPDEPDDTSDQGFSAEAVRGMPLEEVTADHLSVLPEQERIERALDTGDYNVMRGTLAPLTGESTHGMGKPEVRDALEDLLE